MVSMLKNEVHESYELGIKNTDKTNIKNDWQGSIRYAPFDEKDYVQRVQHDADKWSCDLLLRKIEHFKFSQSFTHLNEIFLIEEIDASWSSCVYYLSLSPNFDEVIYIHK